LRTRLAAPAILTLPRGLLEPAKAARPVTSGFGYPGGIPTIAAANGLNTVAFFDNFNFTYPGSGTIPGNATIDYKNTGSIGYKWYVNPIAYSFVNGTCGWYLNGYSPTPASQLSVANSVLMIGDAEWNIIQTIDAGVAAGEFVGTQFAGNQSCLIEVRMQFPSASVGTTTGPALALYSVEVYTGQVTKWQEIDYAEPSYNLYDGFHYHDWTSDDGCIDEPVTQTAPSWSDNDWHTYDFLYTYNSSTSWTLSRYFDGSLFNTFTCSPSNYPDYAIFTQQHWFFLMIADTSGYLAVDWVGVWT
jgi:hypothetical protein